MTALDAAVLRMVREFHAAGWWNRARAGLLATALGTVESLLTPEGVPREPSVMAVVASLERLRQAGLIEARRTGPNPNGPWVYVPREGGA